MEKITSSSIDPEKMSLTLKSLIPFLIFIAGMFGVQVADVDLGNLVDTFIRVILAAGALMTGLLTFWGALRKVLVQIGVIKPKK